MHMPHLGAIAVISGALVLALMVLLNAWKCFSAIKIALLP
jgi:hypothetical protein